MRAILSIIAISHFLCSPAFSAAGEDKPNFLIVFVDDMGYGDLGCFGSTTIKTPRLDRLAAEGTKFTSFYAQTVCGPSRGALMTGRYPDRIGGGWTTNAEEITVAELLKGAGYVTCCIGKWDMSARRYQEALVPNAQGFDHYFGTLGANDSGKVTFYRDREQLETTGDMTSLTRLYTDKGIEFLKTHRDKPFFLYLAHTMVHSVIDASDRFKGKSEGGLYGDCVEELDYETGRLLDALDELGLSEETLVIFTSDNGPWSNHAEVLRQKHDGAIAWGSPGPLRGAKGSTYEGGIRVPCLARWPGKVPAGRTSDAIFSTLDVLPTFAALAGCEIPTDRVIDGVDQRDLLAGRSEQGARSRFHYWDSGELQAVREGPWKLRLPGLTVKRAFVDDHGSQEAELYHLGRDVGERNNLAAEQPEIVTRLLQLAAEAKEIKELRTFYFGNSFTGNTMPGLHPLLGASAGKHWSVDANTAPGVPIWAHMKKQMDQGPDHEKFQKAGPETDAIVMLIFGGDGLSSVVTEKWQGKVKFDQPTDIGDVAACTYLIREHLKLNPQGRAYIYTAWPGIPGVKELRERIQEEAIQSAMKPGESRREVMERIETRKPNHEEMEPLRKSFDYAAFWLSEDYVPDLSQEGGARQNTHCRKHMYLAMEGLRENFPELWKEGRLGMIPVGDVFLELDKKMKAGEVPGIVNIGEYSADGGHLRSGLPRYTLAATYYAVLFREHPGRLDWNVFQDRSNYESGKHGFYVHQPDLAVHLDITAERAKVVNDTIWEVVKDHPYTAVTRE